MLCCEDYAIVNCRSGLRELPSGRASTACSTERETRLRLTCAVEQRTCVVFRLEVSVSHCGHCSDGGEFGETLPLGSSIGSTRKRVRGCYPSVLGPVRGQSAVRFLLPVRPSDRDLASRTLSVPGSRGKRRTADIVVDAHAQLQASRPGVTTPDRLRAGTTFWGARPCAGAA